MATHIIYSIRNLVNLKQYIGRTSHGFDHRYYKGQWWRYTCSPSLRAAAKKYGREAFEVSVVYRTESLAECIEKEVELIRQHNCLSPNGYNGTDGYGGKHWRHRDVFNNNSLYLYTLLHSSGSLYTSDSLTNIAEKTGYPQTTLWHGIEVGRQLGEWKVVETVYKQKPWVQKYILYNVRTGKWVYDTRAALYLLFVNERISKSGLAKLLSDKCKRVGDWVLYRNRTTWMQRAPKRATKSYTLICPSGSHVTTDHLPQLCRKHGLDYQSMMKMIGGNRESYCGWRRLDSREDKMKWPIERIDVVPVTAGTPTVCRNTGEACKRIGCSAGTLYRLIYNQIPSFNGYTVKVTYKHGVKGHSKARPVGQPCLA